MYKQLSYCCALLTSLTLFSAELFAITVTVSDPNIEAANGLRAAITTLNAQAGVTTNTMDITFSGSFVFGTVDITPIMLVSGSTLTINGNSTILDGSSGTFRGLMIESGNVTVNNMTLQNLAAVGGAGGVSGGGGGLGAGGAFFVGNGGSLTLSNVQMTNNRAAGGNGGNCVVTTSKIGGGGGGGLGRTGTGGAGGTGSNTCCGGSGGGLFGAGAVGNAVSGGVGGGGLFGAGGTSTLNSTAAGGGGGGGGVLGSSDGGTTSTMGGGNGGGPSGGAGAASGGGGGNGGAGGTNSGGGGAGGSGGTGGTGGTGGVNGGGGGGGSGSSTGGQGGPGGINGGGGSGGSSPQTTGTAGRVSGAGGYGGGGGGGSKSSGGAGGFGGGGGGSPANVSSAAVPGGAGGFGAGGGGGGGNTGTAGISAGLGGNGGDGATLLGIGGGGGGAALGGTLFVDAGAILVLGDSCSVSPSATPLTAGTGGTGGRGGGSGVGANGSSGSARGQSVFLRPGGTLRYSPSTASSSFTITNLDDGGLTPTTGGLFIDNGTLVLAGTGGSTTQFKSAITVASGGTLSLGTTGSGADISGLTGTLTNSGTLLFDLQSGNSSTFSGSMSGGGNIEQRGSSVILTLSGSNTYTGTTTVTSGTIQALTATNNVFSPASSHTVASGATLDVNSTTQTIGGLSGAGAVTLGTGTLTVTATSPSTFSGVMSGAGGSFVKAGSATQTLTGVSTYTGTTTVSQGTLQVGVNNALPTTSASISSGATLSLGTFTQTLAGATGGAIDLGTGSLVLNDTTGTTVSSSISGSGSVSKSGAGITVISGTNTFSGTTAITAGTLQTSGNNKLSSASVHILSSGVTLDLNDTSQTVAGLIDSGSGTGNVTLGSGTLTVNVASPSTFSGVISGTGGTFVKTGSATQTLAGVSTYTGATSIQAGILQVGIDNALPSANVAITSGATLSLGTFTQTIAGATGGAIDLGTGNLTINDTTGTTVSSAISGTGSVSKAGAGITVLSGTNTYSGNTNITAGTLQPSANNKLASGSIHVVTNGATLDLNNTSQSVVGLVDALSGGGDVTLGSGTLTITPTTPVTFSGVISGVGGNFVKSGSATQTLAGVSTYTGTTSIQAGTLQIGVNNALPPTTPSITSGATLNLGTFTQTLAGSSGGSIDLATGTLIFNNSGTPTISSDLSGSGNVTLQGGGVISLSGSNTYTGTTDVTAGTLRAAVTDTFSANSSHNLATGTTLDVNGTTQTIAGLTGPGAVVLGSGGVLIVSNQNAKTYGGTISGSGALTKDNSGTFTLTNSSNYTGNTTVVAGTLQIAANQAISQTSALVVQPSAVLDLQNYSQTFSDISGTGEIHMDSSGVLTIDTNTSVNFSGSITGAGGLVKDGTGTLSLVNTSSYTGGTTITAGTLIGNSSSLGGTIVNNGILQIDQSTSGTLTGTITGTGDLVKTGTGTVGITDGVNLSGSIFVNDGVVNFFGSTTASGGLNIGPNAAVGGTGNVDSTLNVSGIVAPGTSIGTLQVSSINFLSGSIFEVEFDTTTSDRLEVAGNADITNAVLDLVPLGDVFNTSQDYTILTASSITGTFLDITGLNSLPGYQFTINYFPTSIVLSIVGSPPIVLPPGNAGSAGIAFTNLPSTNADVAALSTFLTSASAAEQQCNFDQMQSAMFNAIPIIQEATTVAVRSAVSDRLEEIHGNRCLREETRGLWATPLANFSKQKGRSQGSACDQTKLGFHSDTYGVSLGVDDYVSDYCVAGAALSYAYTHLHWDHHQASSKTNSGYGSIYGSVFNELFYADLVLTGAYDSFTANRNIYLENATSSETRNAKHHNHAGEFDGYFGTGASIVLQDIEINPFGTIEYIYLHENGYSEGDADSLDLTVQKKNSNLLRAQIGAGVSLCQQKENVIWSEEIALSYIHEQRYKGKSTTMRYTIGQHFFTVEGFLPNRNLIAPKVALTALFLKDLSLTARYSGEFGNKWKTQTGSLEFLWKF